MKKGPHIGICLVLAICLLLLSACSTSTHATGENGNSQPSESTSPERGQLIWSYKTLDAFAGPKNTYSKEHTINCLTYDGWQETAASSLETHRGCANDGRCTLNVLSQCGVEEYFNHTDYSEAFFAENTLLVITLQVDPNNPVVLKDVQYADGSLTCFVELGKPIRRGTYLYKTVYVQVEGVLPENTELKLEITAKELAESELALQWEESYLRLPGTWKLWEKDAPKIAKLLTWESYQAFVEECESHGSSCPTYTEEFFADHSLVVLGLSSGSGSTIYELYDLHYAQGALTCFVDIPTSPDALYNSVMASWLCFIEVDTILPADTEVILDSGGVEYDHDTFMQKHAQFQNLLIN